MVQSQDGLAPWSWSGGQMWEKGRGLLAVRYGELAEIRGCPSAGGKSVMGSFFQFWGEPGLPGSWKVCGGLEIHTGLLGQEQWHKADALPMLA